MKSRRRAIALAVALGLLVIGYFGLLVRHQDELSYSEFRAAVVGKRVVRAQVSATEIQAELLGEAGAVRQVRTVRVEDPDLVRDLLASGARVEGIASARSWNEWWAWLPMLLLLGASLWFGRSAAGGFGQATVGQSRAKIYVESEVKVAFNDVAGVDEAKEELKEVIDFLRTPERFERLGGRLPKGILLVGPPGTGKTLLARAVAGEAHVPFFIISGSEFVELFVGVGAARVRDLFLQAKEKAPCIVFIDELDAIGKARGMGPLAHEEREQTLNQLLVELDGFDPRQGVVLMAATNRPEILDPALLRAGRFDRHVLVDRPDRRGRLAILQVHAAKLTLSADVALDAIAGMTVGMVGADLANLVNEAALLAVRLGRERVEQIDFEEAIERVVAGLEKKNRILTPKERERVAHHEMGHAIASIVLSNAEEVQKISVVPRGIAALGYTLQRPIEDRFLMTQGELETKIAVLLAGRAAEILVFSDLSTGAQDDLEKATDIARAMVMSYGMSQLLGPRSFAVGQSLAGPEGDRARVCQRTATQIDDEVERIMGEQYRRVRAVLGDRLVPLRAAAEALLQRESMTGADLKEFLGRAIKRPTKSDTAPAQPTPADLRLS